MLSHKLRYYNRLESSLYVLSGLWDNLIHQEPDHLRTRINSQDQ
jgi:hypothetical protein